ncbi:MAG: DUF4391 domain-containing protein [Anaerolineaceae bacterium]|nr:DUF4391 domain-containing protein [Anaerolineaceae bacterium]
MICTLLEKIDLPKSCLLGSTIFKKLFLDAGDLSASDKRLLSKHINKVIWQASLKPSNINIQPYQDEVREYGEVEVIEVKLNETSKVRRIAEIVMRTIPYPILLQLTYEGQIMIVAGHSRLNLSDRSKNTIEEFCFTKWMKPTELTEFQQQFFNQIHSSKLSFANFYRFYDDFVKQMIFLNASRWADCYLDNRDVKEVKAITDQVERLESQIEKLKSELTKEAQFNRKVELNVEIKRLQQKWKDIVKGFLNVRGVDNE